MCQDQTAKTPQISALANSKAALYFKNYRIPCQIRLSFKHTQTHTYTYTLALHKKSSISSLDTQRCDKQSDGHWANAHAMNPRYGVHEHS